MEQSAYRDEIRFRLTGGVLDCELDDSALDKVISASLREIQRYIDLTKLVTVPFSSCINLNDYKVNSVVKVYRAEGFIASSSTSGVVDPMQQQQWQLISGTGNMNNFTNYIYNYLSYSTLQQIRNTTSTDLIFRFDKSTNNLYINVSSGQPGNVTIEYVPRYDSVEEITSDFWIDVIMRMAVALQKITLGRIRSRYTQSNQLWTQDGDKLLEEGNSELNALREALVQSTQLMYPID